MENIFNFNTPFQSNYPQTAYQKDFSLVFQLLSDLPLALDYFISSNTSNLFITIPFKNLNPNHPPNKNESELSNLFQQAYSEAFYDYQYFLADVESDMFGKSEEKENSKSKQLHSNLKKNGLTGSSLKLKLNMLQTWWEKLKRKVKNGFVDFSVSKVRNIFKKLMACLNSILGSLTKVFAAIDPIKELKEMLESANNLVEEPE
jgi:hypothetical protein